MALAIFYMSCPSSKNLVHCYCLPFFIFIFSSFVTSLYFTAFCPTSLNHSLYNLNDLEHIHTSLAHSSLSMLTSVSAAWPANSCWFSEVPTTFSFFSSSLSTYLSSKSTHYYKHGQMLRPESPSSKVPP